jgi:hypothetical protein
MNVLLALVAIAGTQSPVCSFGGPGDGINYLSGGYEMTPIADSRQAEALKRAKRGVPMRVDATFAKRATGLPALPPYRFHYLAKAGYLGVQSDPPTFPQYMRFDLDVSDKGVAYVASMRMAYRPVQSEAAVIISSDVPLRRVVSLCGSVH